MQTWIEDFPNRLRCVLIQNRTFSALFAVPVSTRSTNFCGTYVAKYLPNVPATRSLQSGKEGGWTFLPYRIPPSALRGMSKKADRYRKR